MNIPPDQKAEQRFKVTKSVSGPTVGQTIPHDSAVGHVTGSAHYIDDLPRRTDELFVCLLYTSPSPRDKRQSRMPSSA